MINIYLDTNVLIPLYPSFDNFIDCLCRNLKSKNIRLYFSNQVEVELYQSLHPKNQKEKDRLWKLAKESPLKDNIRNRDVFFSKMADADRKSNIEYSVLKKIKPRRVQSLYALSAMCGVGREDILKMTEDLFSRNIKERDVVHILYIATSKDFIDYFVTRDSKLIKKINEIDWLKTKAIGPNEVISMLS